MTVQEFAERNRLKTVRDECNDTTIPGRQGQIYSQDGTEFGVMFMLPKTKALPWGRWSPKTWGNFRRAGLAAGMVVLQDGDSEGCLSFDPENREHVQLAIKTAKVKRRRQASPAQLEHLTRMRASLPRRPAGALETRDGH